MQSRAGRRAMHLVAVLGVALLVPHGTTSADVAETEHRLKDAGVEPGLRLQIHRAVGRAADFLVYHQEEDGEFRDHWHRDGWPWSADSVHTTLVCALALLHAGTPGADAAIRRAFTWVASRDPQGWNAMERNTRSAGLALMLHDGLPDLDLSAQHLAASLAAALDADAGYWSDAPPAVDVTPNPNVRASLFASLGLWCARRQGIDVPADIWQRHGRALHEQQTSTGSWRHHPDPFLEAMGHPPDPSVDTGIPFGRFAGLANLTLASAALREGRVGHSRMKQAVRRATRNLDKDAAELLEDPAGTLVTSGIVRGGRFRHPRPRGSLGTPGDGAYQKLWALELACVLADVDPYRRTSAASRRPERRSWYSDGAEWLLRVQDATGGWSPTAGTPVTPASETDTAYAILFLVRSASAWHPTSPRPVNTAPPAPK